MKAGPIKNHIFGHEQQQRATRSGINNNFLRGFFGVVFIQKQGAGQPDFVRSGCALI